MQGASWLPRTPPPVAGTVPFAAGKIPLCRTEITPEAQEAVVRVLASGWVTTGSESAEFEREFAAWVGAPYAVAVSSCTAAIQLALLGLNLPPGAPVLTPTLTFCGAVQAIVDARLRPVLVDTDEETLTLSAEAVAKAAARHDAVAMVVQHMGGYPVEVAELAAAAGIPAGRVVEDAAHGLGAALAGHAVGSRSRAACFSFQATKNLPIGEGGAITTTDADLVARWQRLRLLGMSRSGWQRHGRMNSWRYTVEEPGLKANFTDVQAAIGRAQLRCLGPWQQRRAAIAERYDMLLAGVPGIARPPRPAGGAHAWHLYIIRIRPSFGMGRDEVADGLAQAGIGTTVHFTPIHHLPYYRDLVGVENCAELSTADRVFPELLSLPMYPGLTDADVARVCQTLASLGASARSSARAGGR
jgi:dTDP-4-amino-4,6-dideoxygalactose transaminase